MTAVSLAKQFIRDSTLCALSFLCLFASLIRKLPGRRFDLYGRRVGIQNTFRKRTLDSLLITPVSSVRYFEFDFVFRHLGIDKGHHILDISSPWLFGMYVVKNFNISYLYTNLDKREFGPINYFLTMNKREGQYRWEERDATNLPYHDNSFDTIISISVIEHISGNGDSRAISEMWRVLRTGGRLIITFPVMKSYKEEYRSHNVYLLPTAKNINGCYFFQRFYDCDSIQKRLICHLSCHKIESVELYGERENGFFENYEKRWISSGLRETAKDPWYMATKMKYFKHFDDLVGLGVIGMAFIKTR